MGRFFISYESGPGVDTAVYQYSTGVNVSLPANWAFVSAGDQDLLVNIENIVGSNFNDTVLGDSLANIIAPLNGSDFIDCGAGVRGFLLFLGRHAGLLGLTVGDFRLHELELFGEEIRDGQDLQLRKPDWNAI